MKIKYLSRWQTIKEVEIERETESSVWIKGDSGSRRKVTDFECYHDTFEQAKVHVVRKAQEDVDSAKRYLVQAEAKLKVAQAAIILI